MSDTPGQHRAAQLLEAIDVLTTKVDTFNRALEQHDRAIDNLIKNDRVRKKTQIALAVSIVLDVILSVALTIISIIALNAGQNAQEASDSAEAAAVANKTAIVAVCESANEQRDSITHLWDTVLDTFFTGVKISPEGQAKVDAVREYVHTNFAPKDCNAPLTTSTTTTTTG